MLSTLGWDFIAPEFVGMHNFDRLLGTDDFGQVLRNTLYVSAGPVALSVLFSLTLTLVLAIRLCGIAFSRARPASPRRWQRRRWGCLGMTQPTASSRLKSSALFSRRSVTTA